MMKKVVLGVFCLVFALCIATAAHAQGVKLVFSTMFPKSYTYVLNPSLDFCKKVETRSGGRVKFDLRLLHVPAQAPVLELQGVDPDDFMAGPGTESAEDAIPAVRCRGLDIDSEFRRHIPDNPSLGIAKIQKGRR